MPIDLASEHYISTPEIDITIDLALELKRPILIEGPAGTGKTSVAIAIANALNWKLYRIQCYEGITHDERGIFTFPNGDRVAWFQDPDGSTLSVTQFS